MPSTRRVEGIAVLRAFAIRNSHVPTSTALKHDLALRARARSWDLVQEPGHAMVSLKDIHPEGAWIQDHLLQMHAEERAQIQLGPKPPILT